ncbi:MAG: flippase-like domain-containing protein [Anaerolineae bacterium]|nr:flippase-like domain-containing protein [Anaerolineae bacterium]
MTNISIANRKSQIKNLLGYALTLIVLFFLGRVLVQTWDQIAASNVRFEFDAPLLIVSLILLTVARVFAVEAWRRVLLSLGEKVDFWYGLRAWYISVMTRYIPGNVWQVATLMMMLSERGVSKTNTLLSQTIYTALALAIAAVIGAMFIVVRPDLVSAWLSPTVIALLPILAALAFALVVIVFALPITNRLIVTLTARVMRRQLDVPIPTFTRGLVSPFFSTLMWVTNGVAFFLFIASITPLALEHLPAFIAINAGAYWIGYVSFITPSGLGFREGALALMLTTYFPTPIAVAFSLATRLWSTIGEVLGIIFVLLLQKFWK